MRTGLWTGDKGFWLLTDALRGGRPDSWAHLELRSAPDSLRLWLKDNIDSFHPLIDGVATLGASLSSQNTITVPLLCRHRQGQGWRWIGEDYYFYCGIQLNRLLGGERKLMEGGQRAECEGWLPFKPRLSVLDYSLPPLLFQSVSSSFLSLILVLPSSASFPVKADLTLLPEPQRVHVFTLKPESQILIDERSCVGV